MGVAVVAAAERDLLSTRTLKGMRGVVDKIKLVAGGPIDYLVRCHSVEDVADERGDVPERRATQEWRRPERRRVSLVPLFPSCDHLFPSSDCYDSRVFY